MGALPKLPGVTTPASAGALLTSLMQLPWSCRGDLSSSSKSCNMICVPITAAASLQGSHLPSNCAVLAQLCCVLGHVHFILARPVWCKSWLALTLLQGWHPQAVCGTSAWCLHTNRLSACVAHKAPILRSALCLHANNQLPACLCCRQGT